MPRPIINSSWNTSYSPGENCMAIIQTGFYDDTQIWEDNKIWWDYGSIGTPWNIKPTITTDYNIKPTITTNWN